MKEITPENKVLEEEQQEEEHRLSFDEIVTQPGPKSPSARPDLLFEFTSPAHPAAAHSYFNDVVFCGKIIRDDEINDGDDLNEYQKRDYFATVKSQSLRKGSPSPDRDADGHRVSTPTRHSGELARPRCSDVDYHAQRVNISSLTSMSAKSRRRMFMFGMVKFKPEMELSAIKQRQAKLPAAEKAAEGRREGSRWRIFKSSFKGRSDLMGVMGRSLGCFPAAGGESLRRRLEAAD